MRAKRPHRLRAQKKALINESFRDTASALVGVARGFCERGWTLGTSGNFSAVISRDPLRLAITPSGVDKAELTAERMLEIGWESGEITGAKCKPSAETLLHIKVMERGAQAVFHTHSVWGTVLSKIYAPAGGISIEGFEMLKGLEGITGHEHREWLPIVENSQDMPALAERVSRVLREYPNSHGFLLQQHGLYTWGASVAQAKRHVEILEFLLETAGRLRMMEPIV
jgi:methylthioribulose-1-phosphate dehydratase